VRETASRPKHSVVNHHRKALASEKSSSLKKATFSKAIQNKVNFKIQHKINDKEYIFSFVTMKELSGSSVPIFAMNQVFFLPNIIFS
jgi:hypothetical protein